MSIITNPARVSTRSSDPVHVGTLADDIVLRATTRQIERQLEKLTNPAFGGAGHVAATEFLAALLVIYEEKTGRAWSPGGEIAA